MTINGIQMYGGNTALSALGGRGVDLHRQEPPARWIIRGAGGSGKVGSAVARGAEGVERSLDCSELLHDIVTDATTVVTDDVLLQEFDVLLAEGRPLGVVNGLGEDLLRLTTAGVFADFRLPLPSIS
ncbi:MAG: hypothetical protein CMJ83_15100 [Planctomycetes bacterium]|nr:hypothetical protein [Planctomycetota bacterium]